MLKWLMRKGIAAFERKWDYDASYVHELIDADPRAAWKFSRAAAIGSYRKDVPLAAWTAAAITAVRHEDCGPCTQLGVSMAEKSGVDPKVLRAILAEDAAAMPDDVALAWRFTRATLDHDPVADEYRQEIVRRWGPRAVISLAFAMVASRIYPTVKYAMGHGKTCRASSSAARRSPSITPSCRRSADDHRSFGQLRAAPAAPARPGLSHARVDGRGRGRRAGGLPALARRRSRRGRRAAGVPDHDDDADLPGRAEVGAGAAGGVRRAVAAGSGHRHGGAGARRADRDRRGSVGGAAAGAGPAVAARARGVPAARRVRLLVHAGGRHAGPQRGRLPPAGQPRAGAGARGAAGRSGADTSRREPDRSRSTRSSCPPSSPRRDRATWRR